MAHLPIKQLYEKLLQSSEIPIIESGDIISKVLLHEYSHHIHLSHHYNQESRAECEIIANGSAFLICREFGLKVCKEVDLSKFSTYADTVERVKNTIQSVADHILNHLNSM